MKFQLNIIFFESYHGSSLCDAHAGHVKKAIRYLVQDGTKIQTLDGFLERIRRLDLKNATFEKMKLMESTMITKLKKIKGIKKLYKFLYDGIDIKAFEKSTDTTTVKTIKF